MNLQFFPLKGTFCSCKVSGLFIFSNRHFTYHSIPLSTSQSSWACPSYTLWLWSFCWEGPAPKLAMFRCPKKTTDIKTLPWNNKTWRRETAQPRCHFRSKWNQIQFTHNPQIWMKNVDTSHSPPRWNKDVVIRVWVLQSEWVTGTLSWSWAPTDGPLSLNIPHNYTANKQKTPHTLNKQITSTMIFDWF